MIRRFQPVIEERIARGPEQYQSEKGKYFQGAWSGQPFKNKVRDGAALSSPQIIRGCHPYARKSASQAVHSRMQLTLHATRRIPRGTSRLVLALYTWLLKRDVLRPGIVGTRGSMVMQLRPCMIHEYSVPSPLPAFCFAFMFLVCLYLYLYMFVSFHWIF